MAKVVGPLHSSEARGSVGSLTYTTWRGISVVKARTGPTKQYEDAQVAIRAKAAAATASWQALTDAQRSAWDDYANAHTDIDWTGSPQRITGYNWYIRANVRRQLLDAPIRTIPPDVTVDTALLDMYLVDHPTGISVMWDIPWWDPPIDLYVEIYGTGPHSPGLHPTIKQCKRLAHRNSFQEQWSWEPIDPGWYTLFARPIHVQGVVCGWLTARAENTLV